MKQNTVDAADQLREGEGKLTPLVGIDCVLSDGPVQQIFFANNRDHPDGPASYCMTISSVNFLDRPSGLPSCKEDTSAK